MNDRNRWSGSREGRGREGYGDRQQGGWGGEQSPWGDGRSGQHEQWQSDERQNWGGSRHGGQQGGWRDDADRMDSRGGEWRGTRDWGDPRSDQENTRQGEFGGGHDDLARGQQGPDGERSWSERAWGGSSVRAGDRGLGGAGSGGSPQRDDSRRVGSQSFASDYGMRDGPNYDQRYAYGRQGGGGASEPGYGRGYGPDYGRDDGRGFIERAGDQIAAWFGDDDAQQRRERDNGSSSHRGRGPGDYTRSDERIREDVNDRLTDDHHVDARRITVTVDKGEVSLAGTVPDRGSKRRAEDVAEQVSGVKHVQNNLRIEQQGGLSSGASPASGASAQPGAASTGTAGAASGTTTGSSGTGSSGSGSTPTGAGSTKSS